MARRPFVIIRSETGRGTAGIGCCRLSAPDWRRADVDVPIRLPKKPLPLCGHGVQTFQGGSLATAATIVRENRPSLRAGGNAASEKRGLEGECALSPDTSPALPVRVIPARRASPARSR